MKTIFGLFAKQPIPGKVKTRLASDIGTDAAADLYAAFLADLTDRYQTTADRRIIGYSPANEKSAQYFSDLSGGRYELWAQPEESLGGRMNSFFREVLQTNGTGEQRESKVVLIGSDSPSLPSALVETALDALGQSDCVLGPAPDGGYYLIGLTRLAAGLFDDIAWSGSRVLEQTVRNITAHGISLHLLPPWYDVDTFDDLNGLRGHLAAMQAAGEAELPRRTSDWVRRMDTMDNNGK